MKNDNNNNQDDLVAEIKHHKQETEKLFSKMWKEKSPVKPSPEPIDSETNITKTAKALVNADGKINLDAMRDLRRENFNYAQKVAEEMVRLGFLTEESSLGAGTIRRTKQAELSADTLLKHNDPVSALPKAEQELFCEIFQKYNSKLGSETKAKSPELYSKLSKIFHGAQKKVSPYVEVGWADTPKR
jgi:hypothetical protein